MQAVPVWLRYLLAYWDFFSMLLLFGGVLCLVAYGLDRSDSSNLYLGVVLISVVVLSASFAFVQVSVGEQQPGCGCDAAQQMLFRAQQCSHGMPRGQLQALARSTSCWQSCAAEACRPPTHSPSPPTALQESKSNALMKGFKDMVPRKARAVRNNTPCMLDVWELVPGDLVEIAMGDLVPGDLRIVESVGLKVDNSPLTGGWLS
jgi:hypothetical protein